MQTAPWESLEFDVVVVGAGAAGCAAAARLAREPGLRVLVVEAGGRSWHPTQQVPKGFLWAMRDPRLAYHYPVTGPAPGEVWLRGKGLGGSTAINGMMYLRGDPADYDALEAAGNPGWGWRQVRRIFLDLERHSLGRTEHRGSDGPLHVQVARATRSVGSQVSHAVLAAAERLGVPSVPDVNAVTGPRMGLTPSTIHLGRRVSAAALLGPARRHGLRILTGAQAGYLLFDRRAGDPGGPRAVGVRVRHRGRLLDLRARHQVLLCCGAVESVLLLERSGVGPAEVLHGLGVEVRVESPMLGRRLIEQRSVTLKARLRERIGLGPRLASPAGRARAVAQYLTTLSGPVGSGAYELCGQLRLERPAPTQQGVDGSRRVDTQLLGTALATDDTGLNVAGYPGMMLQGYRIRPTTASRVQAGGAHPDAPALIEASYLQTADDRDAAAGILAWQRELLATAPLAELVAEELHPGAAATDPDSLTRYVLASGAGIFHAVGSTAMGPEETAVVDPRLRVRGVTGLRVADAGVLPCQVAGGTAAPAMVVGQRAAEFLLADLWP